MKAAALSAKTMVWWFLFVTWLPDIEILRYRSSHLLAIRAYPGSNRPHYLGSEPATGVFVRVGPTKRHADEELIAEMRRFSLGQ